MPMSLEKYPKKFEAMSCGEKRRFRRRETMGVDE
jgi:hypothetical protein